MSKRFFSEHLLLTIYELLTTRILKQMLMGTRILKQMLMGTCKKQQQTCDKLIQQLLH